MRPLPAIVLCLAFLSACADRNPVTPVSADAGSPPRIVSLAPHLTELVYAVGAGDDLVGVVAHSDYPAQARTVPVIGDAFRIDPERLAAVEPDLILAWQGGNPDNVIDQLISRGYTVARLPAGKLSDVAANLIEIGKLTNRSKVAGEQAAKFVAALDRLRQAHSVELPLSVFYQISLQPLYTVGARHPISEMIELCGGKNLFDDLEQPAPIVSLEDVLSRNPDVIIAGDDRAQLEQWSKWGDLSAAANNHLYVVDASLVTRPSTRLLQGAEQICAHLTDARTNH